MKNPVNVWMAVLAATAVLFLGALGSTAMVLFYALTLGVTVSMVHATLNLNKVRT